MPKRTRRGDVRGMCCSFVRIGGVPCSERCREMNSVVTGGGARTGTPGNLGGEAAARSTSSAARLWRNRNFNMFWFGQSLSALGDAFALIAMPLLVLQATGSVVQMGLVTA